LPEGVDQAWPFLVGEAFKAEHVVIAQPGAALSVSIVVVLRTSPNTAKDIVSFGNEHGVSFQFFRVSFTYFAQMMVRVLTESKTEDTGYFYTTDHNFTTPWNFARDKPAATHVVIHIGFELLQIPKLFAASDYFNRANDAAQNVTNAQFVQVHRSQNIVCNEF
jgi:hypothetical protein